MTLTVAIPRIKISPGSHLSITDVSWQDFSTLLEELEEKRNFRLTYFQGLLEIMAPLALHEKPNRLIADIIKAILACQERDWEDYGSTPLKRSSVAGVEPDSCFYIQNALQMRQYKNLDLSQSPPPDLAIECDLTSKTTINAYQAIGIPEVWIYSNNQLQIYLYSEQGYLESEQSQIFPDLSIKLMIPQLIQKAYQVGTRQMLSELKAQLK